MKRARRKPTYGTATRLARLVLGLMERPRGWTFNDIQIELGIGERTLMRYLAACRREIVSDGRPVIETFRRDPYRMVRLAESVDVTKPTSYEVLYLYFALSVFRFLDGTVLKEGVEELWDKFQRQLPSVDRLRLADFPKKFYAVPSAMKDYRAFDDILDGIVFCLINRRSVRIDYRGLLGEGQVHTFDPYTLAMYRGGLYLIGHSHLYDKIIYLAVERIAKAEKLAARFTYPKRYSPENQTEGMFGIIDGPETDVELQIVNPETAAFLAARRMHPTQRFEKRRDGTTRLTMTVRGTTELVAWILSLTPYVKVLRPNRLRDQVREAVQQAAAMYDAP